MTVRWQVEIDGYCRRVLAKHWPGVQRYSDVRECGDNLEPVDLMCGGDPCPVRSLAKGSLRSSSPDLSGYLLALAGRLRPRWVVRENVCAPDIKHFVCGLELLGYRTCVVELDGADFTSQSRRRQFCCGSDGPAAAAFLTGIFDEPQHSRIGRALRTPSSTVPCVTAHPHRPGQEAYCYEAGRGLRLLTCEEAEALMGFPRGWTCGFSRTRRRIMVGNAVIPGKAEWIGRRVVQAEHKDDC